MYIVVFVVIASVPNLYQPESVVFQETPKTKVDSLIQVANAVEKKIDKGIMKKISNNNNELDSLKNVIKRKDVLLRKYRKLLKEKNSTK